MYFRPMPGQTLDPRNLLALSGDDCGVSRRSSPVAHARAPGHLRSPAQAHLAGYGEASPYADTYVVAVNLAVVESDGSRPGRPDCLRGGGQARRHRAACNRGHGLLRCCVEFRNDPDVRKRPTQPLSPEDGWQTSRPVQVHATSAQERRPGSASWASSSVGEWLCNDLGLVLVHDIADVGLMDDGHSVAV